MCDEVKGEPDLTLSGDHWAGMINLMVTHAFDMCCHGWQLSVAPTGGRRTVRRL